MAQAADAPVLIELFTAEGCSSCPPADHFLGQLDSAQPIQGAHLIVLSEHVDYWDRLGWRDPFSSPQFSARQEAYGRSLHSEVYTPQLVIDGREQFVGSDAKAISASIAHAASRPKVALQISGAARAGSEAAFTVTAGTGQGDIWIAIADDRDESSVKRGENNGKTLSHVAVTRTLVKAGSISSSKPFEKSLRLPLDARNKAARIVAFIADAQGGISGAALIALP